MALEGQMALEDVPEKQITSYSNGFYGNGLVNQIEGGSVGGHLS